MSILVTGGCGFIGSNLVLNLLKRGEKVVNLDCLSYNSAVPRIPQSENYHFVKMNLRNTDLVNILERFNVQYIYHLAAQTHVDQSFRNSVHFSEDNVVGTHNLLEAVCQYGKVKRFVLMSTDEVYGQVFDSVKETALMNPTNPYAATKCGAEMLVRSYGHSFGLNYVIARGSNVYGPRQYPDKLIPVFLKQMFQNSPCHIHGSGQARRHFIYVDDVCKGLLTIMKSGVTAEVYNIAGSAEFSVNEIYDILLKMTNSTSLKVTTEDRPFNDQRYHIDGFKLIQLGWAPEMSWEEGIKTTMEWYRDHPNWQSKPKWLVYGSAGWIGQKYCGYAQSHATVVPGKARADDVIGIKAEIDEVGPSHIVCIIGRTHGPGCGTIDWLEQPGHLKHNVRDNLFGPVVLARECEKRGIKMTYMGTGCVFKFTDEQKIFTEGDLPNFFGSSYSIVKGYTDQIVKLFPDTVLNCRIRMPISSDRSPRNFITKITTYEKICSIPNSMTVLEEILPMMVDMGQRGITGTYNMTNPGIISHNEILQMYKDTVDPTFTWKNFSQVEQLKILAADRSNNELTTDKLVGLYPNLRPIQQAVADTLQDMHTKTGQYIIRNIVLYTLSFLYASFVVYKKLNLG